MDSIGLVLIEFSMALVASVTGWGIGIVFCAINDLIYGCSKCKHVTHRVKKGVRWCYHCSEYR